MEAIRCLLNQVPRKFDSHRKWSFSMHVSSTCIGKGENESHTQRPVRDSLLSMHVGKTCMEKCHFLYMLGGGYRSSHDARSTLHVRKNVYECLVHVVILPSKL